MNADLIIQSLDRAGERCADITPLVYAKLFAQHPQMQLLFVRDTNGSVRGEMLFKVIEAILDFIGPRRYANHLIQTEVVTHEGYGRAARRFRHILRNPARHFARRAGGGLDGGHARKLVRTARPA